MDMGSKLYEILKVAILLTFPIWAAAVGITFIVQLHISGSSSAPVVLFFCFAPIIGGIPIVGATSINPLVKCVLFFVYVILIVPITFVVGWGTFLAFGQH